MTRVLPHGSAAGVLKPGDVLLELAGTRSTRPGYYEHPLYGRMLSRCCSPTAASPGDALPLKVLARASGSS